MKLKENCCKSTAKLAKRKGLFGSCRLTSFELAFYSTCITKYIAHQSGISNIVQNIGKCVLSNNFSKKITKYNWFFSSLFLKPKLWHEVPSL